MTPLFVVLERMPGCKKGLSTSAERASDIEQCLETRAAELEISGVGMVCLVGNPGTR